MNKLVTYVANILWLLVSLPGWLRFRRAVKKPQRTQARILKRLLKANRDTDYGRRHGFNKIRTWEQFRDLPITTGADYKEDVQRIRKGEKNVLTSDAVHILQPTSGSSSEAKLIPYTGAMAKQFRAALDAWIADIFRNRPRLIGGPQYWTISPASPPVAGKDSAVPVGFLDDSEYFGAKRRKVVERVMAVPNEVRQIPDMAANRYVTMLFLLRTKSLRLISVWHPSFLMLLVGTLRSEWTRLVTDIGTGGISPEIEVPLELRGALGRKLRPNPRHRATRPGYGQVYTPGGREPVSRFHGRSRRSCRYS